MLKGCRRNMVMVRGDRESVYEVACFLLKSEAEGRGLHETDMLREAERILKHCAAAPEKDLTCGRRILVGALLFVCGGPSGSGLFWLFSLLG